MEIAALIFIGTILVVSLTSCSPKEDITKKLHLYDDAGSRIDDENTINVKFSPNDSNPSFEIENSYEITNKNDQRAILDYIMTSEYYSQEVYGRTIDSMMIEWDAHNDIYWVTHHKRVAHTSFDKNDEGVGYWDFWKRGINEWLKTSK